MSDSDIQAPFRQPPLRSTHPAVDVEGFFRAVKEAQKIQLDKYGVDEALRPVFVEEWPKERLAQPEKPFDFIGFHVALSRRASNSNTEYKPANGLTLHREYPSQEEDGYLKQDWFWKEEAIVQFTIFSQSNKRATDLMNWLRALILLYTQQNFFRSYGVNFLVFHNRLEDTVEKTENQDLYTRRIQFRIHVQNIFNLEQKTLETFHFGIGLEGGSSTVTLDVSADDRCLSPSA